MVLALLSLLGGLISLDLSAVFSSAKLTTQQTPLLAINEPSWLHVVAIVTPFVGILFSWFYFKRYRVVTNEANDNESLSPSQSTFIVFCRNGLGFDSLYSVLLVKPYQMLARLNRRDVVDQILMLSAWYVNLWHDIVVLMQNGSLRWYLTAFGLSILVLVGVSIL